MHRLAILDTRDSVERNEWIGPCPFNTSKGQCTYSVLRRKPHGTNLAGATHTIKSVKSLPYSCCASDCFKTFVKPWNMWCNHVKSTMWNPLC